MKRLVVTLMTIAVVLAPYKVVWNAPHASHGQPFPFKAFEDVLLAGIQPMDEQTCSDGSPLQAVAILASDDWLLMDTPERDIFIHFDKARTADHVYLTKTVTTEQGKSLVQVVEEFQSAQEATAKYNTPCDYLYPKTAMRSE